MHVLLDPLADSYPHLPEEDTEAQLLERLPAPVSLSPKLALLTVVQFSGAKGQTVWDDECKHLMCGSGCPVSRLRPLSGVELAMQEGVRGCLLWSADCFHARD